MTGYDQMTWRCDNHKHKSVKIEFTGEQMALGQKRRKKKR